MQQFNSITIEQYNNRKGVTLIELLIALSIFAIIVVGFSSIDTFSRSHIITSDKKVKLQNDASYVLEHMAKEIAKAIGDINNSAVDTADIAGDTAIQVWIDHNQNGRRDSEPTDRRIAYRYRDSGVDQYQIQFCPECTNPSCTSCSSAWGSDENNILSRRKIKDFTRSYSSSNNYIEIQLTACWDPDDIPVACGSLDNPELVMKNRISMPAVSTH